MTNLQRFNRNLQRRNRAFQKLSPSKKRVAIAKDVLKQIQAKVIEPMSGTYLELDNTIKAEKGTELQSLFTTKVKSCAACAVGSMLFCSIIKGDNLTIDKAQDSSVDYDYDFNDHGDTINGEYTFYGDLEGKDSFGHLKKYFPLDQLKAIENRFEFYDEHKWKGFERNSPQWYNGPSDKDRLIAIMKNIIRNNGRFNTKEE